MTMEIDNFLKELTELTRKHGVVIEGCGTCPHLSSLVAYSIRENCKEDAKYVTTKTGELLNFTSSKEVPKEKITASFEELAKDYKIKNDLKQKESYFDYNTREKRKVEDVGKVFETTKVGDQKVRLQYVNVPKEPTAKVSLPANKIAIPKMSSPSMTPKVEDQKSASVITVSKPSSSISATVPSFW